MEYDTRDRVHMQLPEMGINPRATLDTNKTNTKSPTSSPGHPSVVDGGRLVFSSPEQLNTPPPPQSQTPQLEVS